MEIEEQMIHLQFFGFSSKSTKQISKNEYSYWQRMDQGWIN